MYVDTSKIRECKANLDSYIENLNSIYDSLFENLESITKNNVWVGDVAERYVNSVIRDKKEFYNYISDLREYSKYLDNVAVD